MSDLIERLKRLEDVLLDQCRGNEGHLSFYAAEVVHRAAEQIESLQRENEELRSLRDLKSADGAELNMRAELLALIDKDLSNTHDAYTVFQLAWIEITNQRRRITELEAAAITPEMRDRIGAHRARLENPNTQLRQWTLAADQIFSDLLGEQG